MVYREEHRDNYTKIDNSLLKEKTLSLAGKGLLITMLGLPDDWNYSTVGLASIVKESKNTIYRLLKELAEKNNIKLIVILYLVIWNTCILNIKIYNNCLCEKVLAKKYKVVYNNVTI